MEVLSWTFEENFHRASCRTQAGISHGAPAHRGAQMQIRVGHFISHAYHAGHPTCWVFCFDDLALPPVINRTPGTGGCPMRCRNEACAPWEPRPDRHALKWCMHVLCDDHRIGRNAMGRSDTCNVLRRVTEVIFCLQYSHEGQHALMHRPLTVPTVLKLSACLRKVRKNCVHSTDHSSVPLFADLS